jgi:hypothetical protein
MCMPVAGRRRTFCSTLGSMIASAFHCGERVWDGTICRRIFCGNGPRIAGFSKCRPRRRFASFGSLLGCLVSSPHALGAHGGNRKENEYLPSRLQLRVRDGQCGLRSLRYVDSLVCREGLAENAPRRPNWTPVAKTVTEAKSFWLLAMRQWCWGCEEGLAEFKTLLMPS